MSDTLHKIMTLNDLQKRQAQGAAVGQMGAAMGDPNVRGKGIDRMLAALVAGSQPAMQAYDQSVALSQAQNAQAYKMQQRDAEMQRKAQLDAMREQRLNAQMADNRAYNQKYLEILGRNAQTKADKQNQILDNGNIDLGDGIEGVPFSSLPKNAVNGVIKEMNGQLNTAISMKKTNTIAERMKKLLEKHPGMSEYVSATLADPSKSGGFFETVKRNLLVDKKQLAAIQKFNKYTSDLVLAQSQSTRKDFTNRMMDQVEKSKAVATNTYEANMAVLDNIIEESSEGEAWEDAIRKGLKKRAWVVRDPETFKAMNKGTKVPPLPSESDDALNAPAAPKVEAAQKMFKVFDHESGKEIIMSQEQLAQAQAKGELE